MEVQRISHELAHNHLLIDSFGQLVSLSPLPSPRDHLESDSSIALDTTSSDSESDTHTISPREL